MFLGFNFPHIILRAHWSTRQRDRESEWSFVIWMGFVPVFADERIVRVMLDIRISNRNYFLLPAIRYQMELGEKWKCKFFFWKKIYVYVCMHTVWIYRWCIERRSIFCALPAIIRHKIRSTPRIFLQFVCVRARFCMYSGAGEWTIWVQFELIRIQLFNRSTMTYGCEFLHRKRLSWLLLKNIETLFLVCIIFSLPWMSLLSLSLARLPMTFFPCVRVISAFTRQTMHLVVENAKCKNSAFGKPLCTTLRSCRIFCTLMHNSACLC